MIFRRLSPRAKQKRLQRIVMGVLAAVLALGLIASSIAWTGGSQTEPPKTVEDRIKLLEGQAKKKPEDKGVLLPLAANYSQVGKVEQATETYEKVLKLDPKNISVHQELSLLYYTQGKSDKALQLLESALKIEPNNVEVNYQYAKLLAEKKDYSAAITAMEKVTAAEKEGSRAEEARKSIEAWKMEVGQ